MPSQDVSHVTDRLPEYVLEILTKDEMDGVDEHLRMCAACRAELKLFQQIAFDLPLALNQSTPPPELKQKLMQSIHTRKLGLPLTSTRKIWSSKLPQFFRMVAPTLVVILIVALAVGNLVMWRQLNTVIQDTSTPFRVVAMTNTGYIPRAVGTLLMSPDGDYGTLVVDNLSTLNPDKQYQVWLIKGTTHTSVGVFSVNLSGYASLEIKAPQPILQYDAIGVSIEPAGGSMQPTGTAVLHAYLSK